MVSDTELQSPPAANAFPTPSTTPPRRVPSIHIRRDSSSSPTLRNQIFSAEDPSDLDDIPTERDTLSPLDPRRFTPTLHASLVSEILSLRREIESKSKTIDVLEQTLDDSRNENEGLHESLSRSTKEARSLKHNLQLLEGGTSSAMQELAKDRDEALETISDVRKKLEQAQKKARSREEDVERTQALWDRERESWEGERRNLERKIHVVEGRLKLVLNEVAAAQAAGSFRATTPKPNDAAESIKEGTIIRQSDAVSIRSSIQGPRRTSVTSMSSEEDKDFHNVRYSVASVANFHGTKPEGLSLAQELAFDEEEEDEFDTLNDDFDSPEDFLDERPTSVQSHVSNTRGMKARKILGLSVYSSVDGFGHVDEGGIKLSQPTFVYRDTGIQYSPLSSPQLPPEGLQSGHNVQQERDSGVGFDSYQTKDSSTSTTAIGMVSASCQTIADLPSPPWTPTIVEPPPSALAPEKARKSSVSTQTDPPPVAETDESILSPDDTESLDLEVPMIAIHPPCSEPPTRRGSVTLPPRTKNVSCQANFKPTIDSRSIAIQTEEIRIDQRPVKLPASLLPSAILDLPLKTSNLQDPPFKPYRPPPARPSLDDTKPPLPAKAPSRSKPSPPIQAYPGNNDNGPLSGESKSELRRPFRSSSLFAGFSDEEDSPKRRRDIFTDDAFLNRPFASYKLRRGKLVSTEERLSLDESVVPEVDEHLLDPDSLLGENTADNEAGDYYSPPLWDQRPRAGTGTKQQDIRRLAMISNGAVAHQKIRQRVSSDPSIDSGSASATSSIAPPFPVPIRLSSRKFPLNGSDGRQSPTPSNPRKYSERERPGITRKPALRRVRSAAAMSQSETHDRPVSRSSPSSNETDSPRHPPLPIDDITAPGRRRSTHRTSRAFTHEREDSSATIVQQTSVVDAIAQTMIGEWMLKYVRRRRSFGALGEKDSWEGKNPDEVSANITNSGARHKRWVWLAPYERAVMWSSKQPTNGPALLGKSGRKLAIQSVLDVRDDNPLPKGSNVSTPFNRSILILTPQRALKFTATSIERHYVWLTALSFLSHSASGIHDLASLPPVPQEEVEPPTPTASLRRNPIRDSIRLAKGKPRPRGKRSFTNQPPPVPELPANGPETIDSMMLDAADPPTIPRFSSHARKRSNTNPRIPVMRSFSSQGTMPSIPSIPSLHSAMTRDSPEAYVRPVQAPGFTSGRSSFSRTSDASGPAPSVGTGNFFDAIGTVRMEAFIDQTEPHRYHTAPLPRHRRKVSSQWGSGGPPIAFPRFEDNEVYPDPFRGF